MKKDECVKTPEDIDWEYFWRKRLEVKKDSKKDWNKAARTFHKAAKRDDYYEALFSKLIIHENDTVLDLGCGEGSVTIPLAKKAKTVTGVDSSEEMLRLLNEKCEKQGIKNVKTTLKTIEEIDLETVGHHDIVLSSRSLNNVIPIKDTIRKINEIANKYVFITLFGPENWKIEREFQVWLGNEPKDFPGYNYFFNILYNMGIYPNIERLNIKSYREYDSIEDAMNNGKFRIELLSDEELKKLKVYLNNILEKDPETGKLYNSKDKADWILIWWKIEEK